MTPEQLIKNARKIAAPYRVTDGSKFRLRRYPTRGTGRLKAVDKARAKESLASGVQVLASLEEKLYAQDRWGVLLIFQAMDAAGKDGAIKHVMSGVNPQGCQVFSFKAPSSEDLDHDFLWRCMKCLPERGRIGIFNRSYYEETLVVRVHPKLLAQQKLPPRLVSKNIWTHRFEDIRNFECYLARNGIAVCKFFLYLSKDEQKKRFRQRLDTPEKHWKFSPGDARERMLWDKYMEVYEDMIRHTAAKNAPWYVVPADNKWFSRAVVAAAVIDTLASLGVDFPRVSKEQLAELAVARAQLEKS